MERFDQYPSNRQMIAAVKMFQVFLFHLPAVILPDIISGGLFISSKPCNKYSLSEHWMMCVLKKTQVKLH
jgi:hypothetical protein